MSLEAFFATMKPLLRGEISAEEVQTRLGASDSGTEALAFYRVLVQRNMFKAMREIFPSLPPLVERDRPGAWAELVAAFLCDHPPTHFDPNHIGEPFAAWLQARRAGDPAQPELFEELADFHWIQWLAATSPEPHDDGFDRVLFVRLYRHPIPKIIADVLENPRAELPQPQPTCLVVHRHRQTGALRLLYPGLAAWAVLARRQGLPLPLPLADIDVNALRAAEQWLAQQGVIPSP
jgi:hypothetical protein